MAWLVTDIWLGDPAAPPVETAADHRRAVHVAIVAGLVATALAAAVLVVLDGSAPGRPWYTPAVLGAHEGHNGEVR